MDNLIIVGRAVPRKSRARVVIETAPLYDFTPVGIPVEVLRGKEDGPVLFVCAALHGDEINGIEIIRRLLKHRRIKKIRGSLLAVPIVNVFGFNIKSRYLPDRRDLNRCFPGSESGSLTAQLAYAFMKEIVAHATHGIDLHTAAIHRNNIAQIRGCFDDLETRRLAEAFGVPVMIDSNLRDGSLREAARAYNIPMLLFEGGEALRFNESVIRTGLRGILNVMEAIGMLPPEENLPFLPRYNIFHAHGSHWLRAPYSGILQAKKRLGDHVQKDQILGVISDPFGTHHFEIRARYDGIIIGMSMIPLFNKGDAVFHVATFEDAKLVEENLDQYQESLMANPETFVT